MGRWEPDARGRLQAAALELFLEQGFDQTPAAEIAARAGVTERTFFRHFADKREVLFTSQAEFDARFVAAAAGAPEDATVRDLLLAAVLGGGAMFVDERRAWSRRRQAVIEANPGLREREQLKLAHAGDALAAALVGRGLAPAAADLAARSAIAVYGTAFERWVADGATDDFGALVRDAFAELGGLLAG